MANVTGNPKRTIGTILTMGFSCVLFVIISNYVGNIDTEHEARLSVNHGQFELQLDYSAEYDERYPENNLDTILTDDPLNDSLIEEIKSIPGVTDVMTREIVSVNLNGTRFPADIVSKKDFDFMRQDGDIGSMDYDQAVKNGDIFFGWSTWMEQDGYAPGESLSLIHISYITSDKRFANALLKKIQNSFGKVSGVYIKCIQKHAHSFHKKFLYLQSSPIESQK